MVTRALVAAVKWTSRAARALRGAEQSRLTACRVNRSGHLTTIYRNTRLYLPASFETSFWLLTALFRSADLTRAERRLPRDDNKSPFAVLTSTG